MARASSTPREHTTETTVPSTPSSSSPKRRRSCTATTRASPSGAEPVHLTIDNATLATGSAPALPPDAVTGYTLDGPWDTTGAALGNHTACAVVNGANDAAVQAYLEDQVAFPEIPRLIADALERHAPIAHPTLDEVLAADAWARQQVQERIAQCSPR